MKRLILLFSLLLASLSAMAQFTTVTGTVTDPNGLPYAGGTIASNIVATGTPKFTATGNVYIQPSQASGLDNTGKFIVTLADNTLLTPGSSTWTFTVCSAAGTVPFDFGKGPICFVVTGVTISGASQDIGATLRAAAPALTVAFGGGGSVGGSGTTGNLAEWTNTTVLGNAPITDNGTVLTSTERLTFGTVTGGNQLAIQSNSAPAACAASGSTTSQFNQNINGVGCQSIQVTESAPAGTTQIASAVQGSMTPAGPMSSTPALAGVYGVANMSNGGSPNFLAGVAGWANNSNSSGTVANLFGVVGIGSVFGSQTSTIMGGVDGEVAQNSNVTQPFGAAFYARTPTFTGSGNITQLNAFYCADQTPGGAQNPSPNCFRAVGNAPNAFQGHINQIATGNWAGSCAMSAGTSCTFSITAAYTGTPLSFVSIDAASAPPATAISAKCAVSGTTVTITAGASNSLTWDCLLIGNPN